MPRKLAARFKSNLAHGNIGKARRTMYLARDLDKAPRYECVEPDRDPSSLVAEPLRKCVAIARPVLED